MLIDGIKSKKELVGTISEKLVENVGCGLRFATMIFGVLFQKHAD
jgi:hypothetical protein